MKAKVLLALVALALAVGGYLVLSTDDPEAPHVEPGGDRPVAEQPVVPAATPPRLEAPAVLPASPTEGPERASVSTEERPGWVTSENVRTLRGRIVRPAGTPADEQLSLSLRIVTDSEVFVQGYEQLLEGDTFSLTVPPPDATFELELEGRYLYLQQPLRLAGELPDPVLLEPRLGAWLSGRLIPAAGSPRLELAAGELKVGMDFSAGISASAARGAEDLERRLEPDAAGGFELRAMAAERRFSLVADVPGAPIALVGGLRLAPGEHRLLDLQLEAGTHIAGRVLDESGSPLADAQVLARTGDDTDLLAQQRARRTTTDAAGAFDLAGIPAGSLRISADAEGHLPASLPPLPLAEGESALDLELELGTGASVAGRVLLSDGSPAAGAAVELAFDPAALTGLNAGNAAVGAQGEAMADAEGAFRIQGLGAGPFRVTAELTTEGGPWHFAQATGVRPGDEQLELLLRPVPALTGVVLDADGQAVPEYRLDLRAGNLGGLVAGHGSQKVVSDPEGRFSIDRVEDGSWNLYVRSDGFGAAGPIPADRPGAGDEPLEIVLERGVIVRGRVLDPAGRPVQDALVSWQADARDLVLNLIKVAPTISARTDAEGAFELTELPGGSLSLEGTSADWAAAEAVVVEAAPGELVEDVELLLREGGTIDGLFLGEDGEPLASALVQVQRPGGTDQSVTQTDRDGRFLLERLVPGSWQLVGVGPEPEGPPSSDPMAMLQRLEMEMVEVVDGEVHEVVLGSPPEDPVHLIGQVLPPEEIAGGIAILIPEGEDLLSAMKMAPIDAQGRFELDLDGAGAYVVTIQSTPEGGVGQDSVEYLEQIPEGPEHRLTLRLPAGAVSGRVTGPAGKPLPNTRVSLYADGSASTGTMSGGKYAEATTDASGSYRIGHLEPGSYTVGAGGRPITALFDEETGHGRLVRTGVQVSEGAEVSGVDFELEPAGSIHGRIVDSAGKPVAGASIFVRDDQQRLLERVSLQTSGPDGSFDYRGLAPGAYTLAARSESEATAVEAPVQVRSGEATPFDLALEAATMVEVVVSDGEGKPMVAGIEILDDAGRDVAGQFGMADLTGMLAGDFSTTTRRFGPLPPGSYKVVATAGELSSTKPLKLSGQEERKLKIRLR